MMPVFDQRQMLLDFQFDRSQGGLKLFLVRELESRLIILGVAVLQANSPYQFSNEVNLSWRGFRRWHMAPISGGIHERSSEATILHQNGTGSQQFLDPVKVPEGGKPFPDSIARPEWARAGN
jgi:hypothetical protein